MVARDAHPQVNYPARMHWVLLTVAGLLEIVWAIGMKYTQGWTKLWPSMWTLAAMALSFYLLSLAMQKIPLGMSYTIWVGIGAVGSVIAGVVLFHEKLTPVQLVCIGLIVVGMLGLKLSAAPAAAGQTP